MKISQAAQERYKQFLKLSQQVVRDAHDAKEESKKAVSDLLSYRMFTQNKLRKILTMPETDISSNVRYELLSLLIEGTPTPGPELDLFLKKKTDQ
jgi:hypothetical protein